MINTNLIDSINYYLQHSYNSDQVVNMLKSYGYAEQDVRDTINYVQRADTAAQPQPPAPQEGAQQPVPPEQSTQPEAHRQREKMFIIIPLVLILLIAGTIATFVVMTGPECGNGELEKGETSATCCMDAGCTGEQSCTDTGCVDPVCGACQYLENHACKNHECCDNFACTGNEECVSNSCQALLCGACEYVENHECLLHECCEDTDCPEGNQCVGNTCTAGCDECQYRVDGVCIDYDCCDDDACGSKEKCVENFCVPLICGQGGYALGHECVFAEVCLSNADCDDGDFGTSDICILAGTAAAHCINEEADTCVTDADCDDDNLTTEDVCSGDPKVCSNSLVFCSDIGDECLPSYGFCEGDSYVLTDTDYCCVGECTEGYDLAIDFMDEDDRVLEVEIDGINDIPDDLEFKVYAFEENIRMDTTSGEDYALAYGGSSNDTFFFNFTITNMTINVTAYVDYDEEVNETNETNNNMTIQVILD